MALHNEEFLDLYFSPNTIREIISRRVIWVVLAAGTGEETCIQHFSPEV
jgi:hypothetical protein